MSDSTLLEREKRGYSRPPRRRHGFLRFVLLAVLLLLVFAAGFFAPELYTKYISGDAKPPAELDSPADAVIESEDKADRVSIWNITEILKPASDLVTTRYYYTDADIFENSKQLLGKKLPLTTNKTIFTYDGVISLGIDFSEMDITLDNERSVIDITLPEPKIIANEIDAGSFQYFDVSNSVFNSTEMGDITDVIEELKINKAAKILADEDIMQQASANAESVIRSFLLASELTADYTINFK